jgi:hypothetical protein
MQVLPVFLLAGALCALVVFGLASVFRELLRRDVSFGEAKPSHLARKDNRYGIAAVVPARSAAPRLESHTKPGSDRG